MLVSLVDRILSVEPFREIKAVKNLSFRENYLRDHFPGYALMPGALQLEAIIQAAQWLLRSSLGFPRADFQPASVSNSRYSKYVRPGDQLLVTATLVGQTGELYRFKGTGEVTGARVALCQFELVRYEDSWSAASGLSEQSAEQLVRLQRDTFARLSRVPAAHSRPSAPPGEPAAESPGGAG
ncbi:MAG: beta-hydroxyacyl-ACP dehydratase [Candidatus Riflebacteria bacterium]|nr:beta-hydroxyacyl-ACP dehydratase [Candidatus Riflebacteria bacterium]